MKALHNTLMTVTLVAIVALAVGTLHPWSPAAEAQHHQARPHQAPDPQAHFDHFAEKLSLTAEQREALAEPFAQADAALRELHRLHELIAAELTEEQRTALAEMLHGAMDGRMGSTHHRPSHHDGGHR